MRVAAILATTLILLSPLQAGSVSEQLYGAVSTSDTKIYTVRTQTDITIPAQQANCRKVRVWHAIAAYKPWSKTSNPLGANDLRSAPAAKIEPEPDKRSAHFYFEENRQFAPNTKLSYVSSFKVLSVKRTFNPSAHRCSWVDCQQYLSKNPLAITESDPVVTSLAAKLRGNHDPSNSIIEFCNWISKNITYDETVQQRTDDLSTTIKSKRGHCGHAAQLFHGLCRSVGLQSRDILGLNLTDENGKKTNLPDTWGNTHTWTEVYLPKVGWIEVEPMSGEKCFIIPSTFIQNNTGFQNAAVWVAEGSYDRPVNWGYRGGIYQCDYNMVTRITFSESKN
ncbi:hypothetical protein BH11CYA1_BH11CYA1_20300 [soil metagenome]